MAAHNPAVKRKRLVVAAAILFFFGFPLAGILFPYLSIHKAMRASGEKFLRSSAPEILAPDGWSALEDYGTLSLKKDLKQETFDAWMAQCGDFKEIGNIAVTRSWVSTRGDQGWQFISFKGQAQFTKSVAPFEITVARRSVALDEWRIESFNLNVE